MKQQEQYKNSLVDKGISYSFQKCQDHRVAWTCGKPQLDSKRCECCGGRIQRAQITTCFGKDDITYLGEGLILYFEFIKLVCILSFVAACVYSIPGIYFNYTTKACLQIQGLRCSDVFFTSISVANRVSNFPQMKNQSYYLLAAAIIMFLIIQMYRARFHSIEDHLQMISGPEKYAVFASAENPDFNNEDIVTGIEQWWKHEYETNQQSLKDKLKGKVPNFKSPKIEKIIRSYDIHEPKQIKDRLNQLNQQVQVINSIQDANLIRDELDQLKAGAQNIYLAKNNKAVIVFSHEGYANYIINRSHPFILLRPCVKYETVKFAEEEITLTRAPLPSQILWEHHHLKGRQKMRNTFLVYTLTLLILFGAEAAVFGILYGWFIVGQTLNPNLQTYISGLVSALILCINFILYYLFIFMSKFEYHPVMMQDHISKCLKIIVAVFLNSGLMLLAAYYILGINRLWESSGFVDTLSYSFIYVIATPHLVKYLNPGYIWHWIRMARIKWSSPKYSQKTANRYYQRPQAFQSYHYYAWLITWMWLASFFAPMMPLTYPCVFVTFIIHYWIQKFNYVHLYKEQRPWGNQLNYVMIEALQISQFLLAIGNINVQLALRLARGEFLDVGPILISVIIAVCVAFHVIFVPKNNIIRLLTCYYCKDNEKQPDSYQEMEGKFLTSFEDEMRVYYDGKIDSEDTIKQEIISQITKIAKMNRQATQKRQDEKCKTNDKPGQITQLYLVQKGSFSFTENQ